MDLEIKGKQEIIEAIEKEMLELPQVEFPIEHFFGPGLYIRQMTGLKGTFAIGHEHLTEHVNIIVKGSFIVLNGEDSFKIDAPYIFNSGPGRKAAYFLEDTIWLNIHITDEKDIDKIEKQFIRKSETFLDNEKKENISWHG